jgi:flagellar hook-basal body complex protein FliE
VIPLRAGFGSAGYGLFGYEHAMNDPLRLISNNGPVGGAGLGRDLPGAADAARGNGPEFKDVLLENLRQVNELQQDATRAVEDLTTGKRTDYEGVLAATQKADVAFRMLQALRNRVMEAYDEVKQMRV